MSVWATFFILLGALAAWALLWRGVRPGTGLSTSVSGLRVGREGWTAGQQAHWGWLAMVVMVATALRLYRLDSDLWLDEIVTLAEYMRLPLFETLATYTKANQHPLNSVLGGIAIRWFGERQWAVRLPAFAFGVGGVGALYYFARAVTREREALWATALLAVSYHHVWFSQNARGYTGMIFFSLVGMGLLARAVARDRTRDWVLYALAMAASVFSLLNAVFLLASHVPAYLLVWTRGSARRVGLRSLTLRLLAASVLAGLVSLFFYSRMLPAVVAYYTARNSGQGWTSPLAFALVAYRGLASGLGPLAWVAGVPVGALFITGLISYARQSPFVVGLLMFPALFNVGALLMLQTGAYPRSFLYVLPLGLLMLVRGVFRVGEWLEGRLIPPRAHGRLVPATLGLAVLLSLGSLTHNYRFPKQDYTGALAFVESQRRPGEMVCVVGWAAIAYRDYYAPSLCFPETVSELRAARAAATGIWVLYSFAADMRSSRPGLFGYVRTELESRATLRGTLGDGDVRVAYGRAGS